MADIKWIKLVTDIFENRKIRQIETLPDADTILIIWLKLLCLAGSLNDDGHLYFTDELAYTNNMLATEFRRPVKIIDKAIGLFLSYGMIEKNNGALRIVNWDKYQNIEGMDRIREQTRERVQRYRKSKQLENDENMSAKADISANGNVTKRYGNVTVTQQNKNKNKNENKSENISSIPTLSPAKSTRKKPAQKIDLSIIHDDLLREAMTGFVEFRETIRKPMTQRAVELALKELNKLSPVVDVQIEIIQQSILRGWSGLFKLSEDYQRNPRKSELERLMEL